MMLHWRPGDQIQHTRLTTPIETTRLASLPSTYLDWIRLIRAQPAYFDLGYPAVSVVVTDNAGEWDLNSAEWKAMLLRVTNIEMIYCTPETSKEAGHAESTNSMVEEITKAILLQQNLPEDH